MNREDIIRMAREANIKQAIETPHLLMVPELERFAALVAAAERNRKDWNEYEREIAAAEREACAKVVEASPSYDWHRFACEAAAAIRARGQA